MKQIIVDVSDDGQIRIETKGFIGKACIEEAEFLKNLLGNETFRQLTPAYYGKKARLKKYLQLCG